MQRLFSTFAGGPPGTGLLIQRLLVGTALVYCAVAKPGYSVEAPQVIGALAGILLIAGFWTPVAGVLAGCAEAWVAFPSPAHMCIPAVLGVFGVTLALIGPGEWSLDARLYGRKHIHTPDLVRGSSSPTRNTPRD